jgi:hypothetical protein
VTAEFVILNSARSLASLSFLAAQTSLKNQPWKAAIGQISVPSSVVKVGNAVTVSLQVPGMDLNGARIVWEARDQEPAFGPTFSFSPRNNGAQWIEAEAQWPDGRRVFASASFNANSPDIVWIDDALPAGAVPGAEGGDSWNWIGNPPAPISGSLSHQSVNGSGVHQHFFDNATATLAIEAGDTLYAYVYLDPLNPPSTIMLQWNNGSWDHRAYWGSDNLNYGQNGTASRRFMGPLPVPGQWVQLKVPANAVGLENSVLKGMAFTAYGGRTSWDAAGRLSSMTTVPNSSLGLSLSMTPAGPKLRWNTVANRIYEIAYKNNLNDFLWTTMNELRGTGSPMEWIDPSAGSARQRFYAIREVE